MSTETIVFNPDNTVTADGTTVVVPVITLNGTSAEDLYYQRADAAQGVRDAIGHLQEAAPHARDHKDGNTYQAALRLHNSRLSRLESVLKEIEVELAYISKFVK
jgi:hypothetical protein